MSSERLTDLIWSIVPSEPPGLTDHEILEKLRECGRPLRRTSLCPELHRMWELEILLRKPNNRSRYTPARYWKGPNIPAPPLDIGWPDHMVQTLRTRWAQGTLTQDIADELHVTKDAVVGKAHRLHLPARPSPIRRNGNTPWTERRLRPGRAPTLPPLQSDSAPRRVHRKRDPYAEAFKPPVAAPAPKPAEPPTIFLARRADPCSWPLGEPGSRAFRYCDVPSMPGKSYCEEHCRLAYKPQDNRPHRARTDREDDGTYLQY